ncbi:MAG TPA: GNAT family N-acetyltransferase [Candidatus Dormibacteraeota bacterium]|nr:GNAT family N-acetyltransferase [Candidatus Dormibacteraeota bacterium]
MLETERLRLEPIGPAHVSGLLQATVDSRPELLPWMPWAVSPSLDAVRDNVRHAEQGWHDDRVYHFAVVDAVGARLLGVAGVNRDGPDSAELHYWIRSDHAGRGLATEAGRALVGWAPGALGVRRLTLWAGRENHASRRVAARLGFVHLGPLGWRPEGGQGTFEAESYELELT